MIDPIQKPRARFVILALAGIIGLVLVAGLGLRLAGKVTELRTAPRDNTQYTLFQTNAEFMAMKIALLEAGGRAGPDADEFSKRFDVFYSRINLLQSSRLTAMLRNDKVIARQLNNLGDFLKRSAAIIDAGGHETLLGWRDLGAAIEASQPQMQELVQRSLEQFALQSDQERAEFEQLLLSLAALVTLMGAMIASALVSVQRKAHVLHKQSVDLVESQQQLKATVASALDAVIIADMEGRIIDWNDEAIGCFGYSRDHAVGRKMSELIVPPSMRQAHEAGMKRFLDTGKTKVIGNRIEINALKADGSEFPIELAVGSAKTSRGPIFIAFARDISDRKAKQEELHDAAKRAKAGEKAKAAFLAVMSHEMRTPLNGILGSLELMCDTPLDPRQRKLVETANGSGELLLDLINNVLDLSKVDADKLELYPEPIDLRQMLDQLREMLVPSLQENANQLSVSVDETIPESIEADPGRLRQAVINLLSNANKFTARGAISLDCQLEELGNNAERATLRVSISDTGIGIPKHRLGELFQEFAQIDPSFRRRQGGTGLGLAITRRAVEAMGGKVGVSSTEGHGSTFWLTVPVRLCRAPASPEQHNVSDAVPVSTQAPTRPINILLAEDNFTNAMVASDMLEGDGHSVTHVKNGWEAVLAARKGGFDLVLMDISMPEMDGIEATMMIREHELTNHLRAIPIIALTANAMPEEVDRFRKAGMDHCLTKPIRKQKLVDAIRVLREAKREQAKKVEPAMTDEPAMIPVIDHTVLDELETATSPDLVNRVLDKYLEEAAAKLRVARNAAEAGDLLKLQKMAHSLSGSSSTVGACRLQQLVATIEALCIDGNAETALALARELESVGTETCQQFASLVHSRAA